VEELDAGNFRVHLYALKAAFRASAAFEGQKILVAEVRGQLVQVRLEGDRFIGAKVLGFGAAFLG